MKKLLYSLGFVSIFIFSIGTGFTQDFEVGGMIGVTEYLGELTKKHITYSQSKIGLGAIGRYYFNPRINIKTSLFFGMIEGDDNDWGNYEEYEVKSDDYWNAHWRDKRHLSFKSNIWDVSCQVEFNILPFVSGHRIRNWAPYVYTGVSVFHVNPKAEYNGTWYELQPLGTEGQFCDGGPEEYKLTQISVPYGIGFKYSLRSLWVFGIEATQRKTFTDYMDDVSGTYWDKTQILSAANDNGQDGAIAASLSDRAEENDRFAMIPEMNRGNPDKLDTYFWFGFTVSKTIRKKTCYKF